MPGGNKKIRPEDGKQFSSEYQPQEKWTEKKAIELGNELIAWMKADDKNIFFDDFLYVENDYYSELVWYLKNKFFSFSKLLSKAKKIQETKLVKYGVFDKLNASMTKFTLINNHNWKERSEVENTIKSKPIIFKNISDKYDIDENGNSIEK